MVVAASSSSVAATAPLLEARILQCAFDAVRHGGGDPRRAVAAAAVNLEINAQQQLIPHITEDQVRCILDECSSEISDPLFGLRMVERITTGMFGVSQYLAITSANLAEAWAVTARYTRLLDGVTTVTSDRSSGETMISFTGATTDHLGVHGALTCLGSAAKQVREHVDGRPVVFERGWMAGEPDEQDAIKEALGVRALEVGASSNGLVLEDAVALTPLSTADAYLHAILCDYADSLPDRRLASADIGGIVRELVRRQLVAGDDVTVASAARMMGMSGRTFQRRMLVGGGRFHDVVESVRAELARDMLAVRGRSVANVAYALQYSDVSAFIRAFRRWTGITPGEVIRSAERAREESLRRRRG